MMAESETQRHLQDLVGRITSLEQRVRQLEQAARPSAPATPTQTIDVSGWTVPYRVAQLEVDETWIELHEQSARPQLQRLLRQVVEVEGPVTDRLALDRVRRAWGLRRAGGRVQEAFDQAVRQLIARSLIERRADALLLPGAPVDVVRVPDAADEETRRSAEDVPLLELSLAMVRAVAHAKRPVETEDLSMTVARVFGWSRRGGAIQERLAAALDHAIRESVLERTGTLVRSP